MEDEDIGTMSKDSGEEILKRIKITLEAAVDSNPVIHTGRGSSRAQTGDDPITEADRTAIRMLRQALNGDGERSLSEERFNASVRLENERVWIVEPLDGTRELFAGIPGWCIFVGFVEAGKALA
jgi:myo-inositol-1(or 4)-monophosphatase